MKTDKEGSRKCCAHSAGFSLLLFLSTTVDLSLFEQDSLPNDGVKLDHGHFLGRFIDVFSRRVEEPSSCRGIHFDGNRLALGTGHLQEGSRSHDGSIK